MIALLAACATAEQISSQSIRFGSAALAPAAPAYRRATPVYRPATVAYRRPAVAPVYHAAAPAYRAPTYQAPAYDQPAAYAYNYAVADDYSGVNFNAAENRDGYATTGSYSVALPDGRTQTVNYRVDDAYSGYVADVQYDGYAAAPAYQPAPARYA